MAPCGRAWWRLISGLDWPAGDSGAQPLTEELLLPPSNVVSKNWKNIASF
jgi:hypothetical protein